jgi:hypothetical protein
MDIKTIASQRYSRRSLIKGATAFAGGLALTQFGLSKFTGQLEDTGLNLSVFEHSGPIKAVAQSSNDLQEILNVAVTAEALAVTLLGHVIDAARAGEYDQDVPDAVVDILELGNRPTEQLHYDFLIEAGAEPLTRTFTVPDPSLLTSYDAVFSTFVALESAFVAAYIAAADQFAQLGEPELVKVAYEISTVEAEHRVLANFALGTRPANDVAYEERLFARVSEAGELLQQLGFIGGDGPEIEFPGPGTIDFSAIDLTAPTGPDAICELAGMPATGGGGSQYSTGRRSSGINH